jgi:hypothetical protein
MRARVMVAVASTAGLLTHPGHALAKDTLSAGGFVDGGTPVARVDALSDSGGAGRGRGEGVRCEYTLILPTIRDPNFTDPDFKHQVGYSGVLGNWYKRRCQGSDGDQVGYEYWLNIVLPGSTSSAELAARAMRRLSLPAPAVGTSPPADRDQVVNLPTWLWVRDGWQVRSATASLPGVSVTVTAQPVRVRWEMGDGEHVTCHGPGARYDPRLRAGAQSTDCSYTYRRSSAGQSHQRYRVTATMTWHVTWAATGVAGRGDLGEVSRSTTLQLRVVEGQALVTGSV